MIIANRAAALAYGTDTVAHSLRTVLAAPARAIETAPRQAAPAAPADLAALYPHLFAPAAAPVPAVGRLVRAAAVRVSILGTAAAFMIGVLHH